ncbi:unnamed protein product [Orchesella dallaii]|uniref:BESS domain-containing protein n=1 Tax=Orchesella dallaii TaxID=48710 RepID=A0ABP1RYT6_9HEXA
MGLTISSLHEIQETAHTTLPAEGSDINITVVLDSEVESDELESNAANPQADTSNSKVTTSDQYVPTSTQNAKKRKSNYEYANKPKSQRINEDATTEKLASGITELVNMRKEALSNNRTEKLEFYSVYANLDRMLRKLPTEVVEDLNMEFIKITYDALKLHNTT